jgi:hypothetical protein
MLSSPRPSSRRLPAPHVSRRTACVFDNGCRTKNSKRETSPARRGNSDQHHVIRTRPTASVDASSRTARRARGPVPDGAILLAHSRRQSATLRRHSQAHHRSRPSFQHACRFFLSIDPTHVSVDRHRRRMRPNRSRIYPIVLRL